VGAGALRIHLGAVVGREKRSKRAAEHNIGQIGNNSLTIGCRQYPSIHET
jgi:hypothetical protein